MFIDGFISLRVTELVRQILLWNRPSVPNGAPVLIPGPSKTRGGEATPDPSAPFAPSTG